MNDKHNGLRPGGQRCRFVLLTAHAADQGQEERPDAAERAGEAAALEQDGEDASDLETCESVAEATRAAHSCRGAGARDQWS